MSKIDRLGLLSAILADYAVQIAPYQQEADSLEEQILAQFAGEPADRVLTDEGDSYRLKVGACAEQQAIDTGGKLRVYKFVGKDVFVALSKITFENLKSALTAEQYKSVVTKARTGNRGVKVVVKAAPEPLRAA